MMERKNKGLILLFLLFFGITFAQNETFDRETFISLVKKFHPVVQQAHLQNNMAKNSIRAARGNFDPTIAGKLGEKNIDNIEYYQQKSLEIVVPTWYGVNIIGQYNQLEGNRLNTSETKGNTQQLGIEVPLLKGLLYDSRRAALQQAKVLSKMTSHQQQLIVNDLLLEAQLAYTDWERDYQIYTINKKALEINKARLEMIKKSVEYGERPAIDSIEAISQVQFFEIKIQEAALNLINSQQMLSIFLWNENQQNVLLPKEVAPLLPKFIPPFVDPLTTISDNHPALAYYQNKNEFLQIERKLKRQSLLPKLDLQYQFVQKNYWQFTPLFHNNFQYGLKLEVPLFLRSARAEYQNTQLKLEENNWTLLQKKRELETKLQQYISQYQLYQEQEEISKKNVSVLEKLLQGEEARFQNGEGSVFLINSRENKLFESQEKWIQIQAKILASYYKLLWVKNEL